MPPLSTTCTHAAPGGTRRPTGSSLPGRAARSGRPRSGRGLRGLRAAGKLWKWNGPGGRPHGHTSLTPQGRDPPPHRDDLGPFSSLGR